MLKVGITGGIGSGKSTVCKIFSALGIPVYDADSRAKYLIEHKPAIVRSIKELFGEEAYDVRGKYNRAFIGSAVFKERSLLQKLNSIVHPAVGLDFDEWIGSLSGFPYVIKEAALMNAAGDNNNLDKVIVVYSPEKLRIERIKQRDTHRTSAEITGIIRNQKTDEEFKNMADYLVINNEESLLVPQVIKIHQNILELNEK